MKPLESWTKVTKLSKILAMILFVSLPFIGFYLGIKYQKINTATCPVSSTSTPVSKKEKVGDKMDNTYCGDIPDIDSYYLYSNKDIKSNYAWSPDCHHIAWSSQTVTPSYGRTDDPFTPQSYLGVFVYNDCSKQVQKVYIPETKGSYQFEKWLDEGSFIYSIEDQQYTYSIFENSSQNTPTKLEGSFLVGIWQDSSVMAAGWSNRYHFYPSGNFHYYTSEMNCSSRDKEKIGTWKFENNTLILTTISEVKIVGGKEITSKGSCGTQTIIDGGKISNTVLSTPQVNIYKVTQVPKTSQDVYSSIKVDNIQFWKFSNDPASYGVDSKYPDSQ